MLKTLERITGGRESTKRWESESRSFQRQDLGEMRRREGQHEKSLPGRGNGEGVGTLRGPGSCAQEQGRWARVGDGATEGIVGLIRRAMRSY